MVNNNMTFQEIESKINSVASLNELFSLWQEAQKVDPKWQEDFPKSDMSDPIEAFKSSFCIDGVSSLGGGYNGIEKAEVLFILKESNIEKEECQKAGSVNPFWFNNDFSSRSRKSYAQSFEQVLRHYYHSSGLLETIGYMNLNKRGGAGYTDKKRLTAYVRQYHMFILKEIELIQPEVIFLCGCKDSFYKGLQLANAFCVTTSEDGDERIETLHISDSTNPRLLSIYHPAYSRFSSCLEKIPAK